MPKDNIIKNINYQRPIIFSFYLIIKTIYKFFHFLLIFLAAFTNKILPFYGVLGFYKYEKVCNLILWIIIFIEFKKIRFCSIIILFNSTPNSGIKWIPRKVDEQHAFKLWLPCSRIKGEADIWVQDCLRMTRSRRRVYRAAYRLNYIFLS